MRVSEAKKLRNILASVGCVIMLCGSLWKPLLYVGIVVTFSCLVPHFLYNRCPHCGKQLGRNNGNYCQFCGKELE